MWVKFIFFFFFQDQCLTYALPGGISAILVRVRRFRLRISLRAAGYHSLSIFLPRDPAERYRR